MPELCRLYGIIIRIHLPDHPPPHFHAKYGEHEAVVNINLGTVSGGRLPPRARRLVEEWASLHRDELITVWNRAQRSEPFGKIPPLE